MFSVPFAPSLLLLLLLSSCCCHLGSCSSSSSGMRVDIDEATWPEVQAGTGRWFVQFYAPWCEACQALAPTWQNLAASEGLPRDVSVAQVDVTRNEALAGMFLVTGLPSLYLLDRGQFWLYRGERSLPAMLRYLQQAEYSRQLPLPWYRAPDALHMRALGRLIQAAVRLKQLHSHLVEARGLPSPLAYVALALITLVCSLLLGILLVCLCDLVCGRRRGAGAAAGAAAGRRVGGKEAARGDEEKEADESKVDGEGEGDGEADSDDLAEKPAAPAAPTGRVRKRAGVRKETS